MKLTAPVLLILNLLLITACTTANPDAVVQSSSTPAATVTVLAANTPTPLAAPPQQATAAPEGSADLPTQTLPPSAIPTLRMCSPLQGQDLALLPTLVSNPYHPAPPGSDDPHAGVDLAITLPDSQIAVSGNPVLAALAGQVAMTTQDRFPYGNTVLIETPLDETLLAWLNPVSVPTPDPGPTPISALTCPGGFETTLPQTAQRSLYILYAHLEAPSSLQPGDAVACGQEIGAVGMSGNAINPHLHFEVRVGPAGLRMTSMAHYDASASSEEMSNYCLWRISQRFQLLDPLKLLALTP